MTDYTLFILIAVFILGIGVGLIIAAVIIEGVFKTILKRNQ